VSAVHDLIQLSVSTPQERGDAARNRQLILGAARRLVAERGADAVTTDDIATAAGVGKGTLFRRFGTRANLMMVLLDEDEKALQQAFIFGPPPLGPGAEPLERLLAFGRERLMFIDRHHTLLCQANRDSTARYGAPFLVLHTHVRLLLAESHSTGDLDVQADALLELLDPDYVAYQLINRHHNFATLTKAWESVARKLCGQ
jgi:AcrR family transcriptional regulator